MKRIAQVVAAILLLAAGAGAQEISVEQLVAEFRGEGPARQRKVAALQADYARAVKSLATAMGGGSAKAQQDLEAMTHFAARPGAEPLRLAMGQAIAQAIGANDLPAPALAWLLRQAEFMGRDEVVDAVAPLVGSNDAVTATRAISALANNPAASAGEKLREALKTAPSRRAAILHAMAFRGEAGSAAAVAPYLNDADGATIGAAAYALGRIGTEEAAAPLGKAYGRTELPLPVRDAIADSYLRCAESLAAKKSEATVRVYGEIYAAPHRAQDRMAAARGLLLNVPEARVTETMNGMLGTGEVELIAVAARAAVDMPSAAGVKALAAKWGSLPARAQVIALKALADRGDAAGRSAVEQGLKSGEPAVRIAAIEAMAALGDAGSVMPLATIAANARGAEQAAARMSLGRLRGAEVDGTILRSISQSESKVSAELVRAIQVRRPENAASVLVQLAEKGPDEAVRVEAMNALGILAGPGELGAMIRLLPAGGRVGSAAEAAIGSAVSRMSGAEQRSSALLSALPTAQGEAKLAIIRLLGRSATPEALGALREMARNGTAEIQTAAVRAMAEWPSVEPAGDLLAIASGNGAENVRVLALRGYVRMAAMAQGRSAAETVRMLSGAMKLARPEDRRMVLSAAGTAPSVESLRFVEPYIDDAQLRNEASAAAMVIAKAIDAQAPEASEAAAQKVLAVCQDERIRQEASNILRTRSVASEFIGDWMLSGPYTQEGKDAPALFDVAFAPEKEGGKDASWRRLRVNGPIIDLMGTIGGGQRVAYLRTRIWSPKKQAAWLDMGSDDGIKAWMNGAVVHANNVDRGLAIASDRAKVTLNEGWNTLLLKVTQGGGGWAATARLRGVDEKPIEGLKVKAVD